MPSAHPSTGFQAVILCGPGTSLYPFTGAEDMPKALLPIANKPMLHYPLEWCEKAGVDSILVLTLTEHHSAIQSYLRSHRLQKSLYLQVEAPSSLNENLGTADVLRIAYRKGWIKGDFVVLPCDLVTNLDAQKIAELWIVEQAGFDADMGRRGRRSRRAGEDDGGRRGGVGVWYETKGEGAVKGQETDFLALAPQPYAPSREKLQLPGKLATLCTTIPTQALKSLTTTSELPLRRSLLKKHPNLQILTTHRDSGIYFLPYWILKFIDKNPRMASLREDILPWWAKSCWQNRRLAEKLGLVEIMRGSTEDEESEDGVVGERYDVGSMSSTRTAKVGQSHAPIAFASRVKAAAGKEIEEEELEIPVVTAYLPTYQTFTTPQTFIRRVDTVHLYLFTSIYLAKSDPTQPSTLVKIDPSASIDPKAHVTGIDCLVAEKVTVAEKAVVKRSVLGAGVSIGKGARLMGCVLMEGAVVGEGVKLEGCTIGRKAIIGNKAVLKDCEVAEGYSVEEGAEAKSERFVAFTGLDAGTDESGMEYDEESEDEDEEEEEEEDEDEESERDSSPEAGVRKAVKVAGK
ncbi:Translation initiation factor eIF-2B subunit gamma [Rhizina undulata]